MSDTIFRALVVSKADEKTFIRQITERSTNELPEGEVLVRVRFSSLNYKDGLSCMWHPGVICNYPTRQG